MPRSYDFEKYTGILKEENEVKVRVDHSCDMAEVSVNGNLVMQGNFWDFHNSCHGFYDLPEFSSHLSLAQLFERHILSEGHSCSLVKEEYDFETEQGW